ncbi:phosphate translocator, putative [Trichomonas vaginalis G3]|uniref:Phosphate translocator, putative n=1 Tax=Trichomonas vaginalis (strain ATCC PRA-98 / G3) TaxID=412133 RepID=A2DY80_TRIV3|nr:carbohydrate transport [Trichomonas vaginalis G3]EAY14689.1 phosphate translocator, putative [Trichomonas vaginalis G3]KAI5505453.1 carbohydrate transport [Trichomonas vaginalis G3]|eukprot:XP_001326912.1 phosphate translocator [Trichomonas vaginalis G3]
MGVGNAAWILMSMVSSTALIMTNKYIMNTYHFKWAITLSAYHFFCTYVLLEIMCRLHLFERATHVPASARWNNAFFNVCGIVFMNFNLNKNSVGFYQLSKLCTIPVMVLANYIFYGKKTPFRTLCCLAVLLVGIAMFTINEVSVNYLGCILAIIAVVFTTASQMNTNIASNKYKCFGPPMQHITALPMAAFGLISSLSIETFGENSIYLHSFERTEIILVLFTGVIALVSNVCAFALIGKTSAVTYQVTGHAKTIIIFIIGLLYMDSNANETREQTIKKIIGLIFGMGGTIAYTIFEMQDKAAAAKSKEEKKSDEQELKSDSPRTTEFLQVPENIDDSDSIAEDKEKKDENQP